MNTPVFATSSYRPHTEETMARLADWGFTHIVMCQPQGGHWRNEVELAHRHGLQAILRWPNWHLLGCCGPELAFRAWDGGYNTTGPSCWCPEAEERALASLPAVMQDGWDGLLIHNTVTDRAMPTGWGGTERTDYCTAYWSFDDWARASWAEASGGQAMPAQARAGRDAEFYAWYQSGWMNRLEVFSRAAEASGFRNLWTWFVPRVWPSRENQATATAGSVTPLEAWRQRRLAIGSDPLLVCAYIWGSGWYEAKFGAAITEAVRRYGWRVIAGAECGDAETAAQNLHGNGARSKALGCCGVFASDGHLASQVGKIVW